MVKFNEEDGVWRTIGGRRVFIKNGQSLSDAMKESGKFKKAGKDHTFKMNDDEKKKYEEVGKKMDALTKEIEEEKAKTSNSELQERLNELEEIHQREKENEKNPNHEKELNIDPEAYAKTIKEPKTEFEKLAKQYKESQDKITQYNTERHNMYEGAGFEDEKAKDNLSASDYKKYQELTEKYENERANGYSIYKKMEKEFNEGRTPSNKEMNEAIHQNRIKEAKDFYGKGKTSEEIKESNTNYRNKITDVAKNSTEDNVTLDVETGKSVSFDKGYSVSFQQSSDTYSDEEYHAKVEECRKKCDGKVYAGKYGGDAEASFHTDSLDDAKEIMYKYNQESIYDWQHETLIMNDRYDASKNKTNYKEETTNDIMNKEIRRKADKKFKEDLPKHVEIKEQGTSNRKEVSENIQAHILEYYDSPQDFVDQMDNMNAPTKWHAGEQIAKGGSYLVYYDEQRDFLNELKINPKDKKFSDDKVFNTYTSLIGRESAKLYDRIKRNSYKKYMKEHPLSKMTFEEFKDMEKRR